MSKYKDNGIVLGENINIEDFISIVRFGTQVEFSIEYINRVQKSRALVDKWVEEKKVMYGVTTGFGALHTKTISTEETKQLQKNIILSHSTSVGKSFTIEESRAVMLMVLQSLGRGFSGVRIELLEMYREFLNRGLTPWAPREGSVGYLSPEAHIALVLIGEGKAYFEGELYSGKEALEKAGLKAIELSSKEGLALINGTTSATALGTLALYDMIKATKAADVIATLSLEALNGVMDAFDERVMTVRPHKDQGNTAFNVRNILKDSEVIKRDKEGKVQDALSLRCIPQLHGAVKKTLKDALITVETELNSSGDNPIIWSEEGNEAVLSACNADSSYVGIEMDSACIAVTTLAKMSERRNNRLIDENLSGFPWFLIKNPGLNSGLMIPQYSQAGLLNDMRILATSATIDNTPTCGNQEDYVSMGYNASKKAISIVEKLEYILAIELLSSYQAQQFIDEDLKRSRVSEEVFNEIGKEVPVLTEDMYLFPYIEFLRDMIHSGDLVEIAEKVIGEMR